MNVKKHCSDILMWHNKVLSHENRDLWYTDLPKSLLNIFISFKDSLNYLFKRATSQKTIIIIIFFYLFKKGGISCNKHFMHAVHADWCVKRLTPTLRNFWCDITKERYEMIGLMFDIPKCF